MKSIPNKVQTIVSVILTALIFVLSVIVVFVGNSSRNVKIMSGTEVTQVEGWFYIDDAGSEVPVSLPFTFDGENESCVIHKRITSAVKESYYLCFYTHHQDMDFLINGDVVYSYKSAPRPGWLKSYRSLNHVVKIPSGTEGVISLSADSEFSERKGEFHPVVAGDRLSVFVHIVKEHFVKVILGSVLFFLGIFLLVSTLLFGFHNNLDVIMLHISITMFLVGLWQLEESRVLQLFFGNPGLHWMLEYPIQLLILMGTFFFIRSISAEKNQIYVHLLFVLDALVMAVQLFLQIFSICDLSSSINATHVLLVISCAFGAFCVNRRIQFSNKKFTAVFNVSAVIFMVVFILVITNLLSQNIGDSLISLGVIIMFASLALIIFERAVERANDIKQTGLYKQLAFVDLATGVESHTAWYSYTERFKKNENNEEYCLVMFDMNNLKKMNDTYGHLQGDRMIEAFAGCIKSASGGSGHIFRVGGDEFLYVDKMIPEAVVLSMLDTYTRYLSETKINGVPISAAYGYVMFTPKSKTDFYEAQNRADSLMYKMKREMKAESSFL
ncbi:MAG: diguanylate cyclase [Treponema sp.]|nr:diguanylate cyclase [Treponema sp.]